MNKIKVCVITGTRAEYYLLTGLLKKLQEDNFFELQIIATAMHLSPEFGMTYQDIEKDGFRLDKKIEILLSSDTNIGVSKSVGLGIISFAEAYAELSPDLIILLGDRYEILAAATAGLFAKIPIAHIHGGEVTEGAFDDAIRHSITKMAHFHFVAAEKYRDRVIQMGENPERVYFVGGLGIDNIKNTSLLTKLELETILNCKFMEKNLLVTFHPVTLNDKMESSHQLKTLLSALDSLSNTFLIFTKCNSDPGGRILNAIVDEYVSQNSQKAKCFTNLGLVKYLSLLKYVDAVVGNSSSGILEAPFLKTPTVNIGERQKGRIFADSVLQCTPTKESIISSIEQVYQKSFREKMLAMKNPYGNGNASEKIVNILKSNFSKDIKKIFFDI